MPTSARTTYGYYRDFAGIGKIIGGRLSNLTLGVRFSKFNVGGGGTDFLWKGNRIFGLHIHPFGGSR
ncbi:MAG: hypothetical protein ACJ72N_26080 [Labedaea sp.]